MKAFVTGGSGHVGGNLVRELLSRGYEVDCLVRSDTRALDNLDVSYVNGDMLNPLEMSTLMADSDVVFHSAAFVACLLYTSPSPRDGLLSRMPSSA